jgi:hypothetical protein
MRRFFPLVVAGVVAACAVSVGFAYAGNGSTTTQFTQRYWDHGVLSECTGTRIVQKDGTVKDSETCNLSGDTSRLSPGTVHGRADYCLNGVCWAYWVSDYDSQAATSVNLTQIPNGDGTYTQKVTAYY